MMMKKSLLTILCVLLSTISWAQGTTAGDSTAVAEPYAVLSADSLTVMAQLRWQSLMHRLPITYLRVQPIGSRDATFLRR